jgi:serine/threonine protein kinase
LSAAEFAEGDRLGRYRLDGELGRGGMGVVYRAWDPELERHVALKVVRADRAGDAEATARLWAEAQVTAQLEHPSIVPVHDAGVTAGGQVFYAMRLIEGRTLKQVACAPQAGWSTFRLLEVYTQACQAVAFAHAHHVLHRDLKPDNIMIGPFGEVYVMDWGLNKVLESRSPPAPDDPHGCSLITRDGSVLGTPAFMSPEQAGGEILDPRSDVYALGAILYFLLTGAPPHQGSVSQVLRKIVTMVAAPAPRELNPETPAALDEICRRALSPHRGQRTASAQALVEEVQAALEGRSLEAAQGSETEFLRSYSAAAYRKPSLTVDVVLLAEGPAPKVLLLRRTKPPGQGAWSLPGTFVDLSESLQGTAARVLADKVGIPLEDQPAVEQLGAWGEPGRDPRTRVVTVVFLARVAEPCPVAGGSWCEVGRLRPARLEGREIKLAFDHAEIVQRALLRL